MICIFLNLTFLVDQTYVSSELAGWVLIVAFVLRVRGYICFKVVIISTNQIELCMHKDR